MRFFKVVAIFLAFLWKGHLKAINKEHDLILPQDPVLKESYVPLIDGQPIFIPEEFAETDNKFLPENSVVQNDNLDVSFLKTDEVFSVDQKKYLKKVSNLQKSNEVNKQISKPYQVIELTKRTKICKVPETKKKPQMKMNVSSIGQNFDLFEHLTLQDEVRSMFGPNFKSFVFNPLASSESKFQECITSKNESGVCRYVQHCFLPNILSSLQQFLNNVCIIENRFIGVCCPNFPIQSISINWGDNQETFDNQINTPQECGIGTNTRIVGGSDADIKSWPWMVALLNNKKFFCGGALINDRYILTAAHCTFGVKKNEIIAKVGGVDEDSRVVEIKRHGQYNRLTLRNDIALLKLQKPITFNEFTRTVCFPDPTKNYTGQIATLAGWGRASVSPFTSDVLQEVEFPVVTNEECANTHDLPIPESLICTSAPTKDKSACNGDSGGPLMLLDDENRWKVIGIVSWGRRGCNTKFPSVFTRVTSYLDWIKQHAV